MKFTTWWLSSLALAVLIPSSLSADSFYLQDTFADGSRTNEALPSSAHWFASKVTAGLNVVNDQLQLNTAFGNSGVLAYFTPSTTNLAIGDSLELSFDFILSATVASQDRAFGMFFFNSGGHRLSQDDASGFNSALFTNYTGYGVTYDPGSANPARYRTTERNAPANNLFTSTANVSLGNAGSSAILNPGQTYSGSLVITRNTSSVSINGDINGSKISNNDPLASFTQFDTIAFLAVSTDIPALTVDNVVVSAVSSSASVVPASVLPPSVAPEMSTAMLLGCGLLVIAGLASFGKLLALNEMQRK